MKPPCLDTTNSACMPQGIVFRRHLGRCALWLMFGYLALGLLFGFVASGFAEDPSAMLVLWYEFPVLPFEWMGFRFEGTGGFVQIATPSAVLCALAITAVLIAVVAGMLAGWQSVRHARQQTNHQGTRHE